MGRPGHNEHVLAMERQHANASTCGNPVRLGCVDVVPPVIFTLSDGCHTTLFRPGIPGPSGIRLPCIPSILSISYALFGQYILCTSSCFSPTKKV